ncbi:Uncharacterised protein [Achromobacter sp. 2789STDY5608621]|nr:Uncharacterised protein [Achromobacter sp. 2789STDY5608621]
MSASTVGTRLKFSSACSISRRLSRSPRLTGTAFEAVAWRDVPGEKRMARTRPGTTVSVSVPPFRSWGAARIRVVTNPRATTAFCTRAMTTLMPSAPRQRPVAASFSGSAALRDQKNRWASSPSSRIRPIGKHGVSSCGNRSSDGARAGCARAFGAVSCCLRNLLTRSCWRNSSCAAPSCVCADAETMNTSRLNESHTPCRNHPTIPSPYVPARNHA